MRKHHNEIFIKVLLLTSFMLVFFVSSPIYASDKYDDLVTLFKEWRAFEIPPMAHGAPDYTIQTFDKRYPVFKKYLKRLHDIDYKNWPVKDKVDWRLVLAEMNGFDFNYRILKPWARDPAFYKSVWTERSDVPAHEGPTNHAVTELWTYSFPLSKKEESRLIGDLSVIAPLMQQAQLNLTGNAKELWIAGIQVIRQQSLDLDKLQHSVQKYAGKKLLDTISAAKKSTDNLAIWLEQQAPLKTGLSGIGKENYTWYQQNVHLVPLTWDQEVMVLKRELARAWASLKIEENHNRNRPALKAAGTPKEFDALSERSITKLMRFLKEHKILTVKDYFELALREKTIQYTPFKKRNFFLIGAHFDPTPLYSHFYHWFELAQMAQEPNKSPIRRRPLLYNIFDNRSEGVATAVEEMFMQAGLYDDNPRVREIVWIMIAQRSARGLGSLYAQANELTMKEAGKIHAEWTPRGWMKTEPKLLIFEQHLYLRQPGYGTSYITGKYLFEETMAAYAKMKEMKNEPFSLIDFFDKLNEIGIIPLSLVKWEMTGKEGPLTEF